MISPCPRIECQMHHGMRQYCNHHILDGEGANHPRPGGPKRASLLGLLTKISQRTPLDLLGGKREAPVSTYEMSLSSASTIVGEPSIQEINSDGTTAKPELFSKPSTSPPRMILIMPPRSCRILCNPCNMPDTNFRPFRLIHGNLLGSKLV